MSFHRFPRILAAGLAFLSLTAGAQQAADTLGPTLTKIAARDAIYVGYREAAAPFSYQLAGQNQPLGYTWDICGDVVKAVQQRLGKNVRLIPVPVTDNARVMMLKTGMLDLDCGGAANTVARQKQVGLSNTVYVSEHRVLVRQAAGIERFEQLADKRVVVLAGGIAERFVKQAALGRNITVQLQSANSPVEAMALLSRGEVEAFVGEDAMLAVQRSGQREAFVLLDGGLAAEPYALMLPKDDAPLKKLVDDTLVTMMQGGELARLYDKWFNSPIPPANAALNLPMSPLLKAAIQTPNDKPVN